MRKKKKEEVLRSWSKLTPLSEGQDPLGLNLRVSARLGEQLLHCITSITPRARYYSFLPWCMADYRKREQGKTRSKTLRDAIINRERVFALGCMGWHDGEPCDDGRLVGSNTLKPFYEMFRNKRINISKIKYVEIPAIDAYNASLAGLELYKLDLNKDNNRYEEEIQFTFDEVELSELGTRVAEAYGKSIDMLPVIQNLLTRKTFSAEHLAQWGRYGGLCEIREGAPPDQQLLIDLFFVKMKLGSRSHEFRRYTLALLLETADKLAKENVALNQDTFNDAVYFNVIKCADGSIKNITWPSYLIDIVARWNMFQFHFYLSFALETILVNVVDKARATHPEGFTLDDFVKELGTKSVIQQIGRILDINFKKDFLEMTPQEILACSGIDIECADKPGSMKLDTNLGIRHMLSERNLHDLIAEEPLFFMPEGTVVALILLSVSLLRYIKRENTAQGNWLSQAVDDPYKDITLPVILRDLREYYGDFWNTPWEKLAPMLVNRFVVRQHEALALDKSWSGSRAFFHTDQDVIRWRDLNYDGPTCHNPRFTSAVLILKDLNLLRTDKNKSDILQLSPEGQEFLKEEFGRK